MDKALCKEQDFKQPPFCESVRIYIEQIQEAFAEHYPLSFEDWEDGFRRDENASQQIAVWWYAGSIYKSFASIEPSEERRSDYYKCIVACMTSTKDAIWDAYQPEFIGRGEAEQVVATYFMVTPLNPT